MGLHSSGLMEFRAQHLDYHSIIHPTVRDLTGTFSWPQQNPFLLGNPETFVFCFFLRSNPRAIANSGALCDPMNHSLPDCGHGILQAIILVWVAVSSSTRSSWPRDWTASLLSPSLAGGFFTTSVTWEPLGHSKLKMSKESSLAQEPLVSKYVFYCNSKMAKPKISRQTPLKK